MQEWKLKNTSITTTETYRFNVHEKHGWFIIYIDERNGTFAIHSDYGDYCFSWPNVCRGDETLKEFLFKRADWDYVINKFSYGDQKNLKELKFDETIENLTKMVNSYDANEATLEEINCLEHTDSSNELFWQIRGTTYLDNYNYDELSHCMVTGYKSWPTQLKEYILPMIATWMQDNVDLKTGKLK